LKKNNNIKLYLDIARFLDQHAALLENKKEKNNIFKIVILLYEFTIIQIGETLENIHGLGTVYLHLEKFAIALDYYKKAGRKFKYPGRSIDLANVYRQMDECSKAVLYYKKFIKDNPRNWIGWYNLSQIYKQLKKEKLFQTATSQTKKFLPKKFLQKNIILNNLK